MIVEIHGLELFGHHGVGEDERERRPGLPLRRELELGERGARTRSRRRVDYRAVARRVRELSDARPYKLLESLAAAVADESAARFAVEAVTVRVRKPASRGRNGRRLPLRGRGRLDVQLVARVPDAVGPEARRRSRRRRTRDRSAARHGPVPRRRDRVPLRRSLLGDGARRRASRRVGDPRTLLALTVTSRCAGTQTR